MLNQRNGTSLLSREVEKQNPLSVTTTLSSVDLINATASAHEIDMLSTLQTRLLIAWFPERFSVKQT